MADNKTLLEANARFEVEALQKKTDIAKYMQQTPRSVEKMMARGLPFFRLSARATRFRISDVQKWLTENCKVVRIGKASTRVSQ
jgi:hypothetical protein